MSTRQYVGARYVPKFANPIEWSNSRYYEPLTIVMHEGNSYTSKKYVDYGVDINNTDYWVKTGNYNAQIEEYRKTVERYSDLSKRKFLIIGDSYNNPNFSSYAPNGVTVWGVQAMGIVGALDYTNIGLNGAGWYRVNTEGKTFINALDNVSEYDKYTDIIVCGGINDIINSESETTIRNPMPEIGDFISRVRERLGYSVRIHIGVVGYAQRKKQPLMFSYVNYIRNNEEGYDFEYIENLPLAVHGTEYLLTDKLHPTQKGSTRIANFVVQHLQGHTHGADYMWNGTSSGGAFNVQTYVTISNGIANIRNVEQTVTLTNFIFNGSGGIMSNIDCGILDNYPFVGSTTNMRLRLFFGSSITCICQDASGTKFTGFGVIRLEPTSTFNDAGIVTETRMICSLTLFDERTYTPIANGSKVLQFRLPAMSATNSSLCI